MISCCFDGFFRSLWNGYWRCFARWGAKAAVALAVFCFMLQIADFTGMMKSKTNSSNQAIGYHALNPDVWDTFIDRYDRFYTIDWENWEDYSTYAAARGKSLNYTYLSRIDNQKVLIDMYMTFEMLCQGQAEERVLYIMPRNIVQIPPLYVYDIGGYYIASKDPIEEIAEYRITGQPG